MKRKKEADLGIEWRGPSREDVKRRNEEFAREIEAKRAAVAELLGPDFSWDNWPMPPSLWFDDDGVPWRRER